MSSSNKATGEGAGLAGKVVVVSGAAKGLGRELARGLAAAGAQVAALDLPGGGAGAGTTAPAPGGGIAPFDCDVTDPAACFAAAAAVIGRFGRVDAVINNAGLGMNIATDLVFSDPVKFHQIDLGQWHAMVNVNLNGPFLLTRAFLPAMMKGGRGRIINITTSRPTMFKVGFSPYGPTKAALESATVIWARELAGTGITANALAPGGAADTDMIPQAQVQDRSTLIAPECMVPPAAWLCSDASQEITGWRFTAKDWDPALPVDEAMKRAGVPAGWQ